MSMKNLSVLFSRLDNHPVFYYTYVPRIHHCHKVHFNPTQGVELPFQCHELLADQSFGLTGVVALTFAGSARFVARFFAKLS